MKWDEVCSVKDDIQWRNIDLNLLVTFSYLYRYRSVSLAAEKSFVSQSAMSHSLSRLRVLFDDPLFERKGHKMDPTEHANHIAPTVHHLLDSIAKDLLTKCAFQPENYAGVCRIGLTDYAEFIANTNPHDPNSLLEAELLVGVTLLRATLATELGKRNSAQYRAFSRSRSC